MQLSAPDGTSRASTAHGSHLALLFSSSSVPSSSACACVVGLLNRRRAFINHHPARQASANAPTNRVPTVMRKLLTESLSVYRSHPLFRLPCRRRCQRQRRLQLFSCANDDDDGRFALRNGHLRRDDLLVTARGSSSSRSVLCFVLVLLVQV